MNIAELIFFHNILLFFMEINFANHEKVFPKQKHEFRYEHSY